MNEETLAEYADAWNDQDIDRIMSFHSDDCIFEAGGGSEKYGTRFTGYETVRERLIEAWTELPDARFEDCQHFFPATVAAPKGHLSLRVRMAHGSK